MNVTYTGKHQELSPLHRKKLDARFEKFEKLLGGRGEKEVHVILTSERHLHNAEITVQFFDRALVGIGSSPDLFTALTAALDKIEKQLLKQRTKWRDSKRGLKVKTTEGAAAEAGEAQPKAVSANSRVKAGSRVFRVNHHEQRKPMTLEEALIEMEDQREYLVYRDAETDRVSVLLRRRDGHLALIEA